MRRCGLALVLCAALVVPQGVHAEGGSLVTVVRPPRAGAMVEEATTRLTAELRAAGFAVRVVEGTPGADGRMQVENAGNAGAGAQGGGSFATVAILDTDRGAVADVWVADHVTQKTLVRRVDVSAAGMTNAASDLAVRSVELLRASLLEVSAAQKQALPADLAQWIDQPRAPPPARAVPPPLPDAPTRSATATAAAAASPRPRPAPPTPPAAPAAALPASAPPVSARAPILMATPASGPTVEAAFSVLAGGFGASPRPLLRIGYALPVGLTLRATLAPSVTPNSLSAAAGTVALRQTVGTLDLSYAFHFARVRLYPLVALGAGVYHIRVDGRADAPYVGEHHDFVAAVITASGGLGVRITPRLRAQVVLDVLTLLPEPFVTIAGVEVGRAGRPAFLPSIGLAAIF